MDTNGVKSRSYAKTSLRAWLAMPPFILIRALSCPAPRAMETQHNEVDLGKLDSHPQRTIANPRQIAWNQRPNLLQHSNDCGQTTITSFPGRQPGAHLTSGSSAEAVRCLDLKGSGAHLVAPSPEKHQHHLATCRRSPAPHCLVGGRPTATIPVRHDSGRIKI